MRTIPMIVMSLSFSALSSGAEPVLKVCATIPDLGSLVEEIGGDQVSVTVLAKGPEDPHFVEARPSFVRALSDAGLFIQSGLDLEIGWVPALLQNARNADVLPSGRGFLDASRAITALEVPAGTVDRSMGDVHPLGNPHYLLDPLNGLAVAALLRDKLAELRPGAGEDFGARYETFRSRVAALLVGAKLAQTYPAEKLAVLYQHGRLDSFLEEQGQSALLGGWLGRMLPHLGAKVVSDHNLWPYFARRFGLRMVAFLEPKPGVPPTTKHLREVIERMQREKVRTIFAASYYDPRHAAFVAEATGATVLPMAQQTGSRPGANDYLSMIDYNVKHVVSAFGARE